jgi:hypothetical protein
VHLNVFGFPANEDPYEIKIRITGDTAFDTVEVTDISQQQQEADHELTEKAKALIAAIKSQIHIKDTVRGAKFSFGPETPTPEIEPEASPTGSGKYYVYVHRDAAGRIFYVGKGHGYRAGAKDRHPSWQWYVDTRLGGQYTVQIVSYHETEEEALNVEADYIDKYGAQLINWQNPGRDIDLKAAEQYWSSKKDNQAFVAETRPLETSDPSQAVVRYHEAMSKMYEYESLVLERGLLAEYFQEMGHDKFRGDCNILDRLTLCLWKLGCYQDLIKVVDEFTKFSPGSLELTIMQGSLKRRTKAVSKLAG